MEPYSYWQIRDYINLFFFCWVSNKHFKDHWSKVLVKKIIRKKVEQVSGVQAWNSKQGEPLKSLFVLSSNMACLEKESGSHIQYEFVQGHPVGKNSIYLGCKGTKYLCFILWCFIPLYICMLVMIANQCALEVLLLVFPSIP